MKHPMAAIAAALLASLAQAASAHITLEQPQAVAGSYYKAVLQVPHGCKGSPTTGIRVRIPDGVTSVKPQPKPGWKLAIKRVKLAKPIAAGHGQTIDEVVSEIGWSGGPLPDDEFDEFRIVMKLPDRPGATLYLPVVQDCESGTQRWIETPEAGKASELKEPAPALRLLPKP